MDTFLKYLPIIPAAFAVYMWARTLISDFPAMREAFTGIAASREAGNVRWWKRPLVVMTILVILAWIPFAISFFGMVPTPRPTPGMFNEATIPPKAPERSIGSTFSLQLAQILHSLPQPCLIKLTNSSSSELAGVFSWVLAYGNIPSGTTCDVEPNNALPNADKPTLLPTKDAGVVVHWKADYPAGEKIAHYLDSSGAKVRISHQLDDDAPDNLIWIDIGPGSPWKGSR